MITCEISVISVIRYSVDAETTNAFQLKEIEFPADSLDHVFVQCVLFLQKHVIVLTSRQCNG